ncbi:MAG TPA: aspartate--tRNA(Asn) ligase [Thermomicrobiales bacterium]|jgi:nondiscriminating aspartyl-tRNA synthetase|nr:aspartate--tRNA(Asn) ligase [Thermomicrobiales bacterium]
MERTWSSDLVTHAGQHVRLAGWLHRFRHQSRVSFLVLRDARGTAQVVIEDADLVTRLGRIPAESVIAVTGDTVANPRAPGGAELVRPHVEIINEAEPPPFDLFRPELAAQLPTILDHAPVALRHPAMRARHRLAAALTDGFRASLTADGFTEVHTPKITGTATESGANVFGVDYFGQPAFLAQSPQLYKQVLVGAFERVFEVGPVFRAEPHDTPRHLNQYTSLDVELGFIRDERDVMDVLTRTLREMLDGLAARLGPELPLALGGQGLPELPPAIPVVHFTDAREMVADGLGDERERHEPDVSPAGERWLGEWALHEHGSDFLYVTGYPMSKRPFNTQPDPDRPGSSRGFDLLFRGLELVTGGQRLHREADYRAALAGRGMSTDGLEWYLAAFRHGMPPHGGFAIGLERLVARLTGAANVREVTLFPRDLNRLTP